MKMLVPSITLVDSTAKFNLGQRYADEKGNVYIYLKGVGSVITGTVVSFKISSSTVTDTLRIVANAVGTVGVAMAAIIANKFGWFQIAGLNLVVECDASAAVGAAYIGGDTGAVDHTAAVGDLIHGMQITVADSSDFCGAFLSYPEVTDKSGL